MSGVQLAKLLLPELPGTCLLFMSGHSEESISDLDGLTEVPIRFLQKPFPIQELVVTVRQMLDARPHREGGRSVRAEPPALTAVF
jgi:FixJ family two-component response regulator